MVGDHQDIGYDEFAHLVTPSRLLTSDLTNMILGPVFRAELVRTARRTRYYFMRMFYGLALLLLIWSRYGHLLAMQQPFRGTNQMRQLLLSELAVFAIQTFLLFLTVQLLTLLVLIPALFGGVITDEKERKTIHYLMASRLSSGEIVLDKVLARMLHVSVFVLLGLPILCSLSLFGGIPWQYIAGGYVATLSTVFFAASLSTLVSTLARRVRQGVLISYLLVFIWLVVPSILDPICQILYPRFHVWFSPINAWFQASSPLVLWVGNAYWAAGISSARAMALFEAFLWLVGLQTTAGLLFLLVAMQQLRPAFRRQETGNRRVTWFVRTPRRTRWLRRPECGSDAMLWKECHFAKTDVFTKLFVLPSTVLLTIFLIFASGIDESFWHALKELYSNGYTGGLVARNQLNQTLRLISPVYIGLWLLAVAGASASSLGVERDEDTWVSLTSTPLSGWEILRGKMVGAVWGLRGFGGLLLSVWGGGLLIGALHPLGLVFGLLMVALFTWGVAALGTYTSLKARSTSRALSTTLVILILINGGFLILVDPLLRILGDPHVLRQYLNLSCTPYLTSLTLASFDTFQSLRETSGPPVPSDWTIPAVASILVLAHITAASLLTIRANRQFDVVSDRPR